MSMRQDGSRVWVTLTLAEMLHGSNIGTIRHYEAEVAGRKSRRGLQESTQDILSVHIQGAIGEMVVAKVRDRYFMPTVNTFKDADIGDNVQVRLRKHHHWDMIIRDDDNPEHIFVHVTGWGPIYCVRGWAYAKDVMKIEYRKNHGGHGESWFIPETVLQPIAIKGKVKNNDVTA